MSVTPVTGNSIYTGTQLRSAGESAGTGFASVLSDSIKAADTSATASLSDTMQEALTSAMLENVLMSGASAGTDSLSGLTGLTESGLGGMESYLLASAASGEELSDSQLAMFMLMSMMNTVGDSSDTSMLYSTMATLMDKADTSSGSKTKDTETEAKAEGAENTAAQATAQSSSAGPAPSANSPLPLERISGWSSDSSVMALKSIGWRSESAATVSTLSSNASPLPLERIDGWRGSNSGAQVDSSGWKSETGVSKSTAAPKVSTSGAIIPVNAWEPTTPSVTSSAGSRSAGSLRAVLDQFDVENETRYTPGRNGATYCNIFVWDATSALGCEIPHFVEAATGDAMSWPEVSGARELDANGVHDWLASKGSEYGWREISAEQAQEYANSGYPVVGAWKNPGGIGHVNMVCPSEGEYNPSLGPAITQAGGRNSNYTYQSNIYGSSRMGSVRYFVHE